MGSGAVPVSADVYISMRLIDGFLATHAELGVWQSIEPFLTDGLSAALANAVIAFSHAFQGPFDVIKDPSFRRLDF